MGPWAPKMFESAAKMARTDCVEVLLRRGANPLAEDASGCTAAERAPQLRVLLEKAVVEAKVAAGASGESVGLIFPTDGFAIPDRWMKGWRDGRRRERTAAVLELLRPTRRPPALRPSLHGGPSQLSAWRSRRLGSWREAGGAGPLSR